MGKAGQIEGIPLHGLVGADGRNDDGDRGDGPFQDLRLDGEGHIVDVIADLGMAGLSDGVVVCPDGEEGGSRVDGAEEEDLMDGHAEEVGERGGQGGLGVGEVLGGAERGGRRRHGVDSGAFTRRCHCGSRTGGTVASTVETVAKESWGISQ